MTFQYTSLSFHHFIVNFCPVLQRIDQMPPGRFCQAINICHEGCESLVPESGLHTDQKPKQWKQWKQSFSICNTCSNRLWSHPFCCPYQVGVPVLLISDAHLTTVLLLEPQNFLQNLGLTRSDSPSCKMSNTVIQVHGNKQGSLVVSSSPHRQSSKRVKMHQLTKRSHQHRYLTLSPFANVHC